MRSLPALLAVVVACAPPQTEAPARPGVVLVASGTLSSTLLPALTTTHEQAVGSIAFDVQTVDDGHVIRRLLDGEADLAVTTRTHTPAEEEQAVANGYSLADEGSRHVIAVDVVAVDVHPSNLARSLTYDQVIGIFCSGTIDDWSFLGLDPMPIRAVAPPPSTGSRILFEDFFCGPRGLHDRVEIADTDRIGVILAEDPSAVSFASMTQEHGKILGLRPDPRGPALLPSQQNIIRGSYPLYQDVVVYSPGPATGPAAEFLVWIASPAGQEVVDEARFVPLFLRPDRLDEPRPLRETIHFQSGSSELTLRSRARLQLLVEELQERAGEYQHVVLEGFTDDREADPQALSKRRAEVVAALLAEKLPGTYFEIIPRGSTMPIAPNETPYGRERNRRVQVYLAEEEADFAQGASADEPDAG